MSDQFSDSDVATPKSPKLRKSSFSKSPKKNGKKRIASFKVRDVGGRSEERQDRPRRDNSSVLGFFSSRSQIPITDIRQDAFGTPIKKGGKHKVTFIDEIKPIRLVEVEEINSTVNIKEVPKEEEFEPTVQKYKINSKRRTLSNTVTENEVRSRRMKAEGDIVKCQACTVF